MKARTAGLALCALAAMSCGDGEDVTPWHLDGPPEPATGTFESGTRLQALYWDGGAGATLFAGWHDTLLDLTCDFAKFHDGSWRCRPRYSAPQLFLHSDCTVPVAYSVAGSPVPAYAMEITLGCRGTLVPARVFEVGAQLPQPSVLYHREGGTCKAWSISPDYPVFAVSPADPNQFVSAHAVRQVRSHELEVEILVADDHSRQLGRIFDRSRGTACGLPWMPLHMIDFESRCLPSGTPIENAFADATCSTPGAGEIPGVPKTCPAPRYAVRVSLSGCTTGYELFALGPAVSTPPYLSGDDVCQQVPDPDQFGRFFPETGPADASQFPALEITRRGDGRLSAPTITLAGDSRPLANATENRLWDNERQLYCVVRHFSDGFARCVTEDSAPAPPTPLWGFADASCTEMLVRGTGCTMHFAVSYANVEPSPNLPPITGVRALVGPYLGASVYTRDSTGACVAKPRSSDNDWTLGGAIDPDAVYARADDRTK